MENRSLFDRLGRTEGIRALADDIVDLHMENPVIKARFRPYLEKPGHVETIKKHLVAFVEMGSGGPSNYQGRTMKETHRGMNISEAEFIAAVDDVLLALRKRNIDEQSQKDVLAMLYSLKGEVLHV